MNFAVLSQKSTIYSTKRLLEAGVQREHNIIRIPHLKCIIMMENKKPHLYYNGREVKGIDAIIPRIGASASFYGAAVINQFEMMNVITTVTAEALWRSRDKLTSLQLLSRVGVRTPRTVFTNYSSNVDEVIDMVGGPPLIIKLLEGTQGYGVILAESHRGAKSVIEAFNKTRTRIIVQEFIKESAGSDIRAFVIGRRVVASMRRTATRKGEFRSNLHQGGIAEPIELTDLERKTALKAAATMGLDVAGVDMLQSNRGPLVLEVNASPGLEGIEKTTDVDVARKIIMYLERKVKKQRG